MNNQLLNELELLKQGIELAEAMELKSVVQMVDHCIELRKKELMNQIGTCKECKSIVPINEENKVDGREIYECENCNYPNSLNDFWAIYLKVR